MPELGGPVDPALAGHEELMVLLGSTQLIEKCAPFRQGLVVVDRLLAAAEFRFVDQA